MTELKNAKRIVVKVGTSTLAHPTGLLNLRLVEQLVKVLSDLKNAGREVVLVSSGAIGVGMGKIGLPERPADTPSKQACAAVGQCELMYTYDKYFSEYNHVVAQVLLTSDIVWDDQKKKNVVNTFNRLLSYGTIPIVNENDTVSVEEIGVAGVGTFGENDTLSAIVAGLIEADALIIMTDVDGLFDKNPYTYDDAQLIELVEKIDDSIRELASGGVGKLGTGGMLTKIKAAEMVTKQGIQMALISGRNPENLYDLMDGKERGTLFTAVDGGKK